MEFIFKTIDEYIALFPRDVQEKLQEIRKAVQEEAPTAVEKISWGMPTFYLKGNLIHFAAYKKHIGIYPGAAAIEFFSEKLKSYKSSKGAVQLPLNKPLPLNLICEMVRFNLSEN